MVLNGLIADIWLAGEIRRNKVIKLTLINESGNNGYTHYQSRHLNEGVTFQFTNNYSNMTEIQLQSEFEE